MRNILFFLVFVTVFCGFLAAPPITQRVYPEENPRHIFSLAAQTGFLYGQSREILYADSKSSKYLSELLWDMKPLYYFGAAASFSWNNLLKTAGLFTNLSFNIGVPFRSGEVEDWDWQGVNNALTNYSVHENYTETALFGDADLGLSIPLRNQDRIIAFLKIYGKFSYMSFSFYSLNGYTQYASGNDEWNPSIPKIPVYGKGITYKQEWFLLSPGIGMDFPIGSRWVLGFYFQLFPAGIWATGLDNHLVRELGGMVFEDRVTGGILAENRLELTFSPNRRFAFSAGISYRHIDGSRGASRWKYAVSEDFFDWSKDTSGAGFNALDTRLALKVFF